MATAKNNLFEWIIAGTVYGTEGKAGHFIVTARTYQDALCFFNTHKKYGKVKHYNFAAKGQPSKHKEGHIENQNKV